jgi:hypothetical protein
VHIASTEVELDASIYKSIFIIFHISIFVRRDRLRKRQPLIELERRLFRLHQFVRILALLAFLWRRHYAQLLCFRTRRLAGLSSDSDTGHQSYIAEYCMHRQHDHTDERVVGLDCENPVSSEYTASANDYTLAAMFSLSHRGM